MNSLQCHGKEYWEKRFHEGDTPWDLGEATPLLHEALEFLQALPGYSSELGSVKSANVLCAGAGRGADALELVRHGFDVVAVEWAGSAVDSLRKRHRALGPNVNGSLSIIEGDFFKIEAIQVDIAFEHTFLCALDPDCRPNYVDVMSRWLKPKGVLLGNFFIDSGGNGGQNDRCEPPFFITKEEVQMLFAHKFNMLSLVPAVKKGAGRRGDFEWLGVFERL
jgi:hypothetical protein